MASDIRYGSDGGGIVKGDLDLPGASRSRLDTGWNSTCGHGDGEFPVSYSRAI